MYRAFSRDGNEPDEKERDKDKPNGSDEHKIKKDKLQASSGDEVKREKKKNGLSISDELCHLRKDCKNDLLENVNKEHGLSRQERDRESTISREGLANNDSLSHSAPQFFSHSIPLSPNSTLMLSSSPPSSNDSSLKIHLSSPVKNKDPKENEKNMEAQDFQGFDKIPRARRARAKTAPSLVHAHFRDYRLNTSAVKRKIKAATDDSGNDLDPNNNNEQEDTSGEEEYDCILDHDTEQLSPAKEGSTNIQVSIANVYFTITE